MSIRDEVENDISRYTQVVVQRFLFFKYVKFGNTEISTHAPSNYVYCIFCDSSGTVEVISLNLYDTIGTIIQCMLLFWKIKRCN